MSAIDHITMLFWRLKTLFNQLSLVNKPFAFLVILRMKSVKYCVCNWEEQTAGSYWCSCKTKIACDRSSDFHMIDYTKYINGGNDYLYHYNPGSNPWILLFRRSVFPDGGYGCFDNFYRLQSIFAITEVPKPLQTLIIWIWHFCISVTKTAS